VGARSPRTVRCDSWFPRHVFRAGTAEADRDGLRDERWRALGETERDQKAAAGREGAWRAGQERPSGRLRVGARGKPLGEADDRLDSGVVAEQQAEEQCQEWHCRQQKGAKLDHGGPG
jgi:hypothetical protein